MFSLIEITSWHWVGFIACVLVFLALDLGLFHRHAHVVKFREALLWTAVWFSMAMLFALALKPLRGDKEALEFVTGYLIELSLSMDNVFVIALIFAYFQIPDQYQHRVLFWGIVGALIMRGLMIAAPASRNDPAFIQQQHKVSLSNGAQPLRDDKRCAPLHQPLQSLLDYRLCLGIHTRCGIIQDQNLRVFQQRARNGDALLLPS